MKQNYRFWFYFVALLSLLWAFVSVKWYTADKKCNCEEAVRVVEGNGVIEPSEDRVPDDIEYRPTEEVLETGKRTVRRTQTTETERVIECSTYLNGFMKQGSPATASEVRKLEQFLNDYEGEDLDVNGVYGNDDVLAVNRFQVKYRKEVLDPFGLTTPTGNVFNSTRNHINALHCAYNFDISL